MSKEKLMKEFSLGCNYWATNAGIFMWEEWRPDIIEQKIKKLSEYGLNILRVFPLWPVFQPISLLYTGAGVPMEYRISEKPLSDDEEGRAGISIVAMEYFEEFIKIAQKYHFKLIVGLITGWMSGRLFVPPALEGLNILTDATAIKWQIRFVKYFVKRFIDYDTIIAWDLGNECNCLEVITREDDAWLWSASIVNAIKSEDNVRPIVSGMHSLTPTGNWTIQTQGELTDILTTHPYPIFTPHCDKDPLNTIKTIMHSTCESQLYSDIGKKPCIVEEIGNLGPMVSSNEVAKDFGHATMFSTWANGCDGYLWWCANDQDKLSKPPYDWYSVERELGLLTSNGEAKPILSAFKDFKELQKKLPFEKLPPKIKDAICILSLDQDNWGIALGSYTLAKQAGLDIEFTYATQDIKEADLYFLPCVKGHRVLSRGKWLELLQRVYDGATLYISYDGGFLSHFEQSAGIRLETRYERTKDFDFELKLSEGDFHFSLHGEYGMSINPLNAEVLGIEENGNPIFTRSKYGKGQVLFLGCPLELYGGTTAGAFYEANAQPFWQIYSHIKSTVKTDKCITKNNPMLGITEHMLDENSRIVIVINYSKNLIVDDLTLAKGWQYDTCLNGEIPKFVNDNMLQTSLNGCDSLVFVVNRGSLDCNLFIKKINRKQ